MSRKGGKIHIYLYLALFLFSFSGFKTVTVHLTASVLFHNGENEAGILEALSKVYTIFNLQPTCQHYRIIKSQHTLFTPLSAA